MFMVLFRFEAGLQNKDQEKTMQLQGPASKDNTIQIHDTNYRKLTNCIIFQTENRPRKDRSMK